MLLPALPRLSLALLLACAPAARAPPACPDPEPQFTVSHTYRLDVPDGALLQVDADPAGAERSLEQSLEQNPEQNLEQNLVFRHHIRLQAPQDCALADALRALLDRVDRLEADLGRLRERCGSCCARAGADPSPTCSDHGTFSRDTCSCHCEEGWVGPDCATPATAACPENCSDHGECVQGVCVCHPDYTSEDCSELRCPADCSGHGFCDTGECYCEEGFTGHDCAQAVAPQGLHLLRSTQDSLLVGWEPSGQADHHVLSYHPLGHELSGRQVRVPKERHTYEIPGLLPGTEYVVTLRSVRKDVASRPQALQASTDPALQGTAWVTEETEHSLDVEWENPPTQIDYYKLHYRPLDGREVAEVTVPKSKEPKTRYDITGLQPGTDYQITVVPVRGDQEGTPIVLSGRTELDSPAHVVTERVTEDTALVSWAPVQAVVDKYVVRYTSAAGDSTDVAVGSEQSSTLLTGLEPGQAYTVLVWAERGDQESKKADTQALTDLDSPQNLVTKQVTETTATVSWDPVRAPIDRYMVRVTSPDGDSRDVAVGKEQTSTVLTGLRPGVEYTVLVWAEKGARGSRKADTKAPTDLDSPQNLVTKQVTETTATVSWDPVRAPIDRYMVRVTSPDGDSRDVDVGKEQTSTVLTGLRPGVEYTVLVWAEKGTRGSRKADTKAPTGIDPPKNLRPSAVTQSGGVLTWAPPDAVIDGYILTYRFPDGTAKEVTLGPEERSFKLQGLEQGATHPVSLVAFRGERHSTSTSTALATVGVRFPHPADCSQVQQNGNAASGLYTIFLHGTAGQPLQVYCDMDTDGGGWIVFQRRNTGQLDFFKRWRTYVEGFGDPTKEFWLGLGKLHNLTSGTPTRYEVRVDLHTANESAYAVYDSFQVASAKERYRLSVGKYQGTAGDALTYHNGWKFTTFDRDNDIALSNCALTHHGGWWYKNCHLANPNGRYGETKHSEGVNWEPWKGHEFSIPHVELKIRPHGHSRGQ